MPGDAGAVARRAGRLRRRSRRASRRTTRRRRTANVISTAGDATLSVSDPSSTNTGKLVNGTFALPQKLQAKASSVGGTPARRRRSAARPPDVAADLQRPGQQRRGHAELQADDRRHRAAPHGHLQQDAHVHAVARRPRSQPSAQSRSTPACSGVRPSCGLGRDEQGGAAACRGPGSAGVVVLVVDPGQRRARGRRRRRSRPASSAGGLVGPKNVMCGQPRGRPSRRGRCASARSSQPVHQTHSKSP